MRFLMYGSPAKLEDYSSRVNFWEYKNYGNHTSVKTNVENTQAILNKEDKYKFMLSFPNWLTRFIPHLHITPSGLVIIPGGNDRFIFDGSFMKHADSQLVNLWTDKSNEPPLVFPKATSSRFIIYASPIPSTKFIYGMMISVPRFGG